MLGLSNKYKQMNKTICKICNHPVTTFIAGRKSFKYHKCPRCKFIFLNKIHILSPEKEKKRYDTHQNSIENEGYVNMFENFIEKAISPYTNDIKTVLDYGSGSGAVLSELLKRKGFEVDIYDPFYSPEKIYLTKKYDLISSTEVFEHFSNPVEEIKKLYSLLNPKGIISIMTNFIPDNTEFNKWWYINDETHISFFHLKTFEKIAEMLGFEFIEINKNNICVLIKE